jgi:SAM-dependent methyltransferase
MVMPLDWPPIRVDVHASDDQLHAMIGRVEKNFEHLGQTEPHWSILAADQFRSENIRDNEEEFFASGRVPVQELQATAARCGFTIAPEMTCLEHGCGIARSTIWLADLFGLVMALDVSKSHLALADKVAHRFNKDNIFFLNVADFTVLETLPLFDILFSILVLQHNPPPLSYKLLSIMLRKLRPGGAAYFQILTYIAGYSFDVSTYLASQLVLGPPEMHVIPQADLLELFRETGCSLLELREDGSAGYPAISSRFFVRKN